MIADLQIGLLFDGVDIFASLSQEQYKLTAGISGQQHNNIMMGQKSYNRIRKKNRILSELSTAGW
jgi:hypothetical protein